MWGLRSKLRRGLVNRFVKSSRGATAVEFALVGGPFFFLLGSIAETGLMLFSEYVLQNSVQEAARSIRTGQVTQTDGTQKLTDAQFKALICENVSVIIDCDAYVTVYVNSSTSFAARIVTTCWMKTCAASMPKCLRSRNGTITKSATTGIRRKFSTTRSTPRNP